MDESTFAPVRNGNQEMVVCTRCACLFAPEEVAEVCELCGDQICPNCLCRCERVDGEQGC